VLYPSNAEDKMQPSAPIVNVTGNDNVVSVGQIGGITARTVTIIEQPLKPELRILVREDSVLPDGSHVLKLKAEVRSPITPGLLAVQIAEKGIKDVQIMPEPVGGIAAGMMMRNYMIGPEFFSAEIPSPRGRYDITITTQTATNIQFAAGF
jgi:hypothetical protein